MQSVPKARVNSVIEQMTALSNTEGSAMIIPYDLSLDDVEHYWWFLRARVPPFNALPLPEGVTEESITEGQAISQREGWNLLPLFMMLTEHDKCSLRIAVPGQGSITFTKDAGQPNVYVLVMANGVIARMIDYVYCLLIGKPPVFIQFVESKQ